MFLKDKKRGVGSNLIVKSFVPKTRYLFGLLSLDISGHLSKSAISDFISRSLLDFIHDEKK